MPGQIEQAQRKHRHICRNLAVSNDSIGVAAGGGKVMVFGCTIKSGVAGTIFQIKNGNNTEVFWQYVEEDAAVPPRTFIFSTPIITNNGIRFEMSAASNRVNYWFKKMEDL